MRALIAPLTVLVTAGCYASHTRTAPDDVDASAPLDGSTASDAGPEPPPGCNARCAPPELRALVALPRSDDSLPPTRFDDVAVADGRLLVLTSSPTIGHARSAQRVLTFDPATNEVRASEPWRPRGLFPVHHGGARFVEVTDTRVVALVPSAAPRLEGALPTEFQTMSLHRVEWSRDGEVIGSETLTTFPRETLACPGGCEAGVALEGERVVVSYAPEGTLWTTEIDRASGDATPWRERRAIDDPAPEPWPHSATFWNGEHWIAGGGTPDLALPREPLVFGPSDEESMDGTRDDRPPRLLGGDTLVIARHVLDGRSGFRVKRLRPGEPVQALDAATHGVGGLDSWIARDAGDRLTLAWTALAPGSLRDTVVSVVPDAPFEACDVVEPTVVATIPEGIAAPSVLVHPLEDQLYVMAFANDASGRAPQLAVFALAGCALTE